MEQFANAAISTLSAAITSTTSTSLTVTSATLFPTSGVFRILIDSEILKVTAVSGNTFTVVRGDGSTTAATHSSGAQIVAIMTKQAMDSIVSIQSAGTEISTRRVLNIVSGATVADNAGASRCDLTIAPGGNVIGFGVGASKPAAGNKGNLYVPTDGIMTSIDSGSIWDGHNPYGAPFTIPPVLATGWTKTNSGGATFSDVPGGGITVIFNGTQASADPVTAFRSLSSGTSYTFTAAMQLLTPEYSTSDRYGITVTDGTKTIMFGIQFNGDILFDINTFTALTSPTVASLSSRQIFMLPATLWLQISNNGTKRLSHKGNNRGTRDVLMV
jgi:hypothetical protein